MLNNWNQGNSLILTNHDIEHTLKGKRVIGYNMKNQNNPNDAKDRVAV